MNDAKEPDPEHRGFIGRFGGSPLVHPVLFAAYPVLFLWAQNLSDAPGVLDGLRLIAVMVGLALVAVLAAGAVVRDLRRACFVASVVVGSFAAFGRVAREVGVSPSGSDETLLLIGWCLGSGGLIVVAGLIRARAVALTRLLNLVAAVMVGLNLAPIVGHHAKAGPVLSAAWDLDPAGLVRPAPGTERDIYYLIFDRYAGEQTLRDLYDFDDSVFLQGLRDRGFVVVDGALANYPQTTHSLASSLNLTTLEDLADEVGRTSSDWGPLRASLGATTLSRTLQALGYRYIHMGSWWAPTWDDPTADVNYTYGGLEEFDGIYWQTTMWPALAERLGIGASQDQRLQQFERVHYQIEKLAETARDPRPTFTFAHFTLPHTPYVFHADGSLAENVARPSEVAYIDQLRYTNTAIEAIVADLLSQPGPEPIIVLQSDEGPHPPQYDYAGNITWAWSRQSDVELGRKLRILEAFYLPGLPDRSEYADITPVNTFRLILNDYFGAGLRLEPDRTYVFDDYEHPYRFTDVTGRLRSDGQ